MSRELQTSIKRIEIAESTPEQQRAMASYVLGILASDYTRTHGSPAKTAARYNPDDEEHIQNQVSRLLNPAKGAEYWDIRTRVGDETTVSAAAKTGLWLKGDRAPFERWPTLTHAFGRTVLRKANGLHVFAIEDNPDVDDETMQAATTSSFGAVRRVIPAGNTLHVVASLDDELLVGALHDAGAEAGREADLTIGGFTHTYRHHVVPPVGGQS